MLIYLFVAVMALLVGGFVYALIAVYQQDENIRKAITVIRDNRISVRVVKGNSTYNFRLPYKEFSMGLSDDTIKCLVDEAVIRAVHANKPGKEKVEHNFSITSDYANEANRFHARRIATA